MVPMILWFYSAQSMWECHTVRHGVVLDLNCVYRLKNDLKKKQKEAGLPMKSLLGECKTRWGSKFEMVKRMFVNIKPVQSLLINGTYAIHDCVMKIAIKKTWATSQLSKLTLPSMMLIVKYPIRYIDSKNVLSSVISGSDVCSIVKS